MYPGSFSQYPSVYHLKNRYILIGISVFLIFSTLLEFRDRERSTILFCLTLISMVIWTYMLLMALRRRLVITQEGLEYSGEFNMISAKWPEVKKIVKRRTVSTLWITTEGLVIFTDVPDSKEYFVDLAQFGRRWRQEPLGAVLQMKAPHLFA